MLRYAPYLASLALTLLSVAMVGIGHREWGWVLAISGTLLLVGTADLLQKLEGRAIKRFDGREQVLRVAGATRETVTMSWARL